MTCPGVRIVELFLEVLNLNFPRHCKSQLKIFKEVLFITFYYLFITCICFLIIFIYQLLLLLLFIINFRLFITVLLLQGFQIPFEALWHGKNYVQKHFLSKKRKGRSILYTLQNAKLLKLELIGCQQFDYLQRHNFFEQDCTFITASGDGTQNQKS